MNFPFFKKAGTVASKDTLWMDNVRIISVFCVVLVHVSIGVMMRENGVTFNWWISELYDGFARWCVPVLVMISGALLLDSKKKETIEEFYKKRFAKIFWPLVFWSIFFMGWAYAKGLMKGAPLSGHDLIFNLLEGRPYVHLWYLFMICGLYALTPFLRKLVVIVSQRELLFLTLSLLGMSCLETLYTAQFEPRPDFFATLFLPYVPYFLLGHVIRETKLPFSRKVLFPIFLVTSLMSCYGFFWVQKEVGWEAAQYFRKNFSIFLVLSSVSLFFLMKDWGKPLLGATLTKKVSALTFGVYLVHLIIMDLLKFAGVEAALFSPIMSIPLMAVVVFAISAVGVAVLQKIPYLRRIV